MHPQLEERLALGHTELLQLRRRADPDKHVVPKSKREKKRGNVEPEFPVLINWELIPVPDISWDRELDEERKGTYKVCSGSLVFLV